MFFLYQLILLVLVVFSPIIFLFRILKNKEHKKRFTEKFSLPSKKRSNGKLIWFHGASVGEILSIIPIIKNYEKDKNINQILLTTSTLSSSKVLGKFKFKKTIHQFYPIDSFLFTNKFLKFWKPSLAVFVDSEIWPCMFKNINNKKIPLILFNARVTKKTFNRWIKFKNFSTSVFKNITVAYPQTLETKSYLKKLKINKIQLLGNIKFAENREENLDKLNNNLKKQLLKKKIWVASSTHQGEELFCARAHIQLKKKIKNLITIIIPRHINRCQNIISDLESLNLKVSYHSLGQKNLKDIDVYIVDTFGETNKFHKIACSVFLGGSIIYRGGQNPLEAARYGAKILHGPDISNFKDVYKLLRSFNISKKIHTPRELASSISFKRNKNIGNKIKNIGENILKKTIKEFDNFIIDELKKT